MGVRHLPYEVVMGKYHERLPLKWCQDNIGPRWSAIGPERETGLWTVFWVGPEAPENIDGISNMRKMPYGLD